MPIKYVWGKFAPLRQPGRGLYTSGDVQRGQVPTPSEARRGLSSDDPERRWFELTEAQKAAWNTASPFSQSGRSLYSTVNRLRLNTCQASVETPPGSTDQPLGVVVSNVSACWSCILPGFPTYLFDTGAGADGQWVEVAIYKASTGTPGTAGTGARWLIAGMFPLSAAPSSGNEVPMGGFTPCPAGPLHPAPSPPPGTAIRLRFITCTADGYPGQAQTFSLVVGS